MYKCTAVSPTPPATCETYAGYASTFCTVRSCLPNGRGKLDKKEEKNRMQRHHWVTKKKMAKGTWTSPKDKERKKDIVTGASSKQVCSARCCCFEEAGRARVQSRCSIRWKVLVTTWQGPTRARCKDIIGPQHGQASGKGLHGTWSKEDGEGKTNLAHLGPRTK